MSGRTNRAKWLAAAVCCATLMGVPAFSQVASYGDKQAGDNTGDQLPQVLQKVQVSQHLNQQLPLNAAFVDETGKQMVLGDYFGKRPAVLALVYYNCPMLCSEEMDGLTGALEMVHLTPGKDFDVVIISIDPTETPEMAAQEEGVLPEAIWASGDSGRLALSDRSEAGDRCSDGCRGFWLCACSGAGWEADAVCARELD